VNLPKCLQVLFVAAVMLSIRRGAMAQEVRVRVVDNASVGIEGAVVELLNAGRVTLQTRLTNSEGGVVFTAPRQVRYYFRVERIGFETYQSDAIRIDSDTVWLRISPQPVTLPSLNVRVTSRCGGDLQNASAAYTLWNEAKKTLRFTLATAQEETLNYSIWQYTRTLDASLRLVKEDTQRINVRSERGPFTSISGDSLLGRGFVQPAAGGKGWLYFAPDADVLLSESFRAQYCFNTVTDRKQPHLIGLDFQPAGPQEVPGIEGTLWMRRETLELLYIEFSFTRVPYRVPVPGGGRIDFARLPNGGLVVGIWTLRVPILRDPGDDGPIKSVFLRGYSETIRKLSAAARANGEVVWTLLPSK